MLSPKINNNDIINPLYTHISECEKQLFIEYPVREVSLHKLRVQSRNAFDFHINRLNYLLDPHILFMSDLFEDTMYLIGDLVASNSNSGYYRALSHFCKHRTGKGLVSYFTTSDLSKIFDDFFGFKVQSQDTDYSDYFNCVRGYLSKFEEIKESPVYKKLYKFVMYILSSSVFSKIGLTFEGLRYSKIEAEALRKKYHMGTDFFCTVLDTLLFVCERGYQCMRTGSMDPMYHSGTQYEKWYEKYLTIKTQSTQLSNPEPHGFTRFSFLSDLNDHIEKGEAMYAHAVRVGTFEKKLLLSYVSELKLIKSVDCTKKAAQQERKAPFSILLYGGSSVAKSTLSKLLFYQYGKTFNLPTGDEFRYTRNAINKYWDNFCSSQWCIQLDDIAFLRPSGSPDPTLMEMLQVNNNVPFVPVQADIADKGRTPVTSRFLIATTNTEDLNATSYFSCPLAVQRRLPFIVDVQPKAEYSKYGSMIDGAKLPPIEDGEYPNYWNFIIKAVKPFGVDRKHQKATICTVHEFTDIYQFVAWFSEQAIEHERIQNKSEDCDNYMSQVTLCSGCHVPNKHCICEKPDSDSNCNSLGMQSSDDLTVYRQSIVDELTEIELERLCPDIREKLYDNVGFFKYYYMCFICIWLKLYFTNRFIHKITDLFCYNFLYRESKRVVIDRRVWQSLFAYMGDLIQYKFYSNPLLYKIMIALTTCLSFYKIYNKFSLPTFTTQDLDSNIKIDNIIGKKPKEDKEEIHNVWYKDQYVTTDIDIPIMSSSYKSLDSDIVINKLFSNCVHFRSIRPTMQNRSTRAICVGGHLYICNSHGIYTDDEFDLEIIQGPKETGITSNITTKITQSQIFRVPHTDIAFVTLRCLPPKKKVINLFHKLSYQGKGKGYYLSRNPDGSKYFQRVENIVQKNIQHDEVKLPSTSWTGYVQSPTEIGMCGSIMVMDSGNGPMILGIHILGGSNHVVSHPVTVEDIENHISSQEILLVQAGSPVLSAPGYERNLDSLHVKSPARYISQGSAHVFGSFTGFRPKSASKVQKTLLADNLFNKGFKSLYGPPVMKTWEPWHLALKDMVKPVSKINENILNICVESFTEDILSGLSVEDLASLHAYDQFTAVNGANNVAYVDKINRNTSAGNPFKKSKQYFLEPIEAQHGLQDPVQVTPEIQERIDDCMSKYRSGTAYAPNFCAHLKDEPVTFKKIEMKKTRVFTGAPMDWSIVVRQQLLPFIRLVQSNRFLFESAPGTVAQSEEWNEIRDYLTHFGPDRIVAGDYVKFDKQMSSVIILAAFDIIINIYRRAGWSQEELLVIQGIAEDTAFSWCDFNGDLIQFFGTNPSGHPLTVIINGLVNSLYMRYCYYILNPEHEVRSFKKNIHLLTYGDDNIMNVNRLINWFFHTSIMQNLKMIDVGYTMADKEAESVPFIHIDQSGFLKRGWRYEIDLDTHVCPLELESITKMLTYHLPSKTVSNEHLAIISVDTALREYFWHGRQIFESMHDLLINTLEECNLQAYMYDYNFPTWDGLISDFKENSKSFKRTWKSY